MALSASCPNCHYDLSNLANVPPEITRSARLNILLASNEIPLSSEVSNLMNIASGASQVARDLEQRIKELESLLRSLGQTRLEMVQLAEDCKAVMHPVRRIPQEILSEIFLEASVIKQDVWRASARSDIKKEKMPLVSSLDRRAPPWTLSQVAQRWRIIALSYPRIWSSIALSILAEDTRDNHQGLSLQLQRSANHKLDVYIASDLNHDDFVARGSHLLSLLLSSSTRWESFYYRADFTDVLSQLEGFLPNLRLLYLTTLYSSNLQHLSLFRLAPALRTIVCGPSTLLRFQFPLTQIEEWGAMNRYLNRSSNHVGAVLALLQRLPALKVCRITLSDGPSNIPIPPGPAALAELRCLSLTGSMGADLVISRLVAPKLDDLTIIGEVDVNGLSSFIQRSRISLDSFDFSSLSADEGQVLSLLQQMPWLQNLTLRTPTCYDDTFFLALQSAPGLIATLRTLTLRGPVECPQALVSLRESRPGLMIELEM
ncbi:hypothetical protein C8J56DRAFT_857547 [Mycena floridula]|nr:hypothetical protein C8J56DRAFT_857547 [Mycena floridula]